MMRLALLLWILLGGLANEVLAQGAPGIHQDNGGLNGSLSRADLEKLSGDRKPQDPAASRAASEQLLIKLKIACQISAAQRIAQGTIKSAARARAVESSVYEVACLHGFGYLLEVQGSETPLALSCLKAEETRAADVAAGKAPGFFCKLPENRDVHATVGALIQEYAGSPCTVTRLQSFGRSESTQSSYSEIVCQDGAGYMLRTPLPGSATAATAFSCAQAAQQGIKCRLTQAGEVHEAVTLETLKAALVRFGVSCPIDATRLIGQEDHRKRYVLEYHCADQAASQVAFVPMGGNDSPYEALDCAAAAASDIHCELSHAP